MTEPEPGPEPVPAKGRLFGTAAEAAGLLGEHRNTVYREVKTGEYLGVSGPRARLEGAQRVHRPRRAALIPSLSGPGRRREGNRTIRRERRAVRCGSPGRGSTIGSISRDRPTDPRAWGSSRPTDPRAWGSRSRIRDVTAEGGRPRSASPATTRKIALAS